MPKTSAQRKVVKKSAPKKAARKPADFSALFASLKKVLAPYSRRLVVKYDGPGIYYLETAVVPKYGTEVFFGAVRTGKRHVSFHFMPVHVFPELLDDAPQALKASLKGESRFDFTEADPALLKALARLAKGGYDGYRRGGLFKA
jgi:hypothetical protein